MFRLRQTEDLEVIKDLNLVIFPITGAIDDDDLDESTWWVAELAGEPVGFGGVRLFDDHAYLTRAGVVKEARGKGLQQRLIQTRVRFAKAHGAPVVRTYVWTGNIASMRSLVKCGFLPYLRTREPAANGGSYPCTFIHLERKLAAPAAKAA